MSFSSGSLMSCNLHKRLRKNYHQLRIGNVPYYSHKVRIWLCHHVVLVISTWKTTGLIHSPTHPWAHHQIIYHVIIVNVTWITEACGHSEIGTMMLPLSLLSDKGPFRQPLCWPTPVNKDVLLTGEVTSCWVQFHCDHYLPVDYINNDVFWKMSFFKMDAESWLLPL